MTFPYRRVLEAYRHLHGQHTDRETGRLQESFRPAIRAEFGDYKLDPWQFDPGRWFAECYGWSEFNQCRADRQYTAHEVMYRRITEAEGAVTTAAFLNVTGQIIYDTVLPAYQNEDFVFTKLVPEVPAGVTLGPVKVPGITQIGPEVLKRKETDPYTLAGVGEDWIFAPAVEDRGLIVPLTWEALFAAEKVGLPLQDRAKDVGYWSGYDRETRAIDCCIDENTTGHRYNWRGTVIPSYGDNTGAHSWDNLAGTNALVDWTDVDGAEQVFNAITDPYTGAPSVWEPKHLTVYKGLERTASRILSATEIRVSTPGFATSGNPTTHVQRNEYANKYALVTSRLLAQRLATDTDWFVSDWGAYAAYRVAEKLDVLQAPPNNMDEFSRRIVMQWRVNERGNYYVRQPRAAVKSTVA